MKKNCGTLILTCTFILGSAAYANADETKSQKLSEYSRFVPENADFLIVRRPRQQFANEVVADFLSAMPANFDWLPTDDLQSIELVVVAASSKAITKMAHSRAQATFEDISKQIETLGFPETTKPGMAHYLNTDFAGVIRFTDDSQLTVLANWLYKSSGGEFHTRQWKGYQLTECKTADCCVIVQLDPMTFLVGNKTEFARALQVVQTSNTKVAGWLQVIVKSNFSGEYFIAVDTRDMKDTWGGFPQVGTWKLMDNIQSFELQVDFSRPMLARLKIDLEGEENATELASELDSLLDGEISRREKIQQSRNADLFPLMPNKDGIKLLKKITFRSEGRSAYMEFTRPENFDSIIAQITRQHVEFNRSQSSRFESIANESKAQEIKVVEVLIAGREIESGQTIQESDIQSETWPADIVPGDAFQVKSGVIGRKVTRRLYRGEPLMSNHFEKVEQ